MTKYARVEIVVEDSGAAGIIAAISEVAHTGIPGDGLVYVVPVEEVHRIRDHRGKNEASEATH